MVETWQRAGFGLYVHWPFCAAKCPYCDFNSHVADRIDQARWAEAYRREIARVGAETPDRVLTSVFFGGGTPSLMQVDTVRAVMDAVRATWTLANDIEITLEANPTSVEANRFARYREAGVDRVSVGVQALEDGDLRALGRRHDVAQALEAVNIARRVFPRVSFDLIYARQHQSLAAWRSELSRAIDLGPDHLSLYQLTIEDGTAFGDRFRRGRLPGLPDEDLGADLYAATQQICDAAGLPAYEVSNHARPGQESRHNLIYWRGGDYAGIGPGAHGRLTHGDTRFATETPLQPGAWLAAVESAGTGESLRQSLSPEDRRIEALMMGLRLREGIDLALARAATSEERRQEVVDLGLAEIRGDRFRVTDRGRPVLNAILGRLIG